MWRSSTRIGSRHPLDRPHPPQRWSRRRGVLGVFAAFAAVGFVAAYIGPTGVALSQANAEERQPITLYSSTLGDVQSLQIERAADGAATAPVGLDRGGYTVYVTPKPTPTPEPVGRGGTGVLVVQSELGAAVRLSRSRHRAGHRLRDGSRTRLGRRSVRLPRRAVEQGVRLARERVQRRQRRVRHPAVPARQQDGQRRRRLGDQPGDADHVGSRLHRRPLRHPVRRVGALRVASAGTEPHAAVEPSTLRGARRRGIRSAPGRLEAHRDASRRRLDRAARLGRSGRQGLRLPGVRSRRSSPASRTSSCGARTACWATRPISPRAAIGTRTAGGSA